MTVASGTALLAGWGNRDPLAVRLPLALGLQDVYGRGRKVPGPSPPGGGQGAWRTHVLKQASDRSGLTA